jgi:phosphatidylserine decarboxylase
VPIDPSGFPFVFGALAVAAGLAAWLGVLVALPFLVLAGFFTFFFRDPERRAPVAATAADVLSPADGTVLVAGASMGGAAPSGSWKQISIFLSPMDVHVNRVPVSGRVTRVLLTRGRFLPAYRPDAATVNERSEIWIDHAGQTVVARQIVGILARRVVCRLQGGEAVQAGQRFGVMKFGSRMDVFVPDDAEITVRVGETVRGGETIIAVLHSPQL